MLLDTRSKYSVYENWKIFNMFCMSQPQEKPKFNKMLSNKSDMLKSNVSTFQTMHYLKEQCHEIFRVRFFSSVIHIRNRLPGDEYTGESIRIT